MGIGSNIRDFGLGTVKGVMGDGVKGLGYGAMATVAVGITAAMFAATIFSAGFGLAAIVGLVAGGLTAGPALSWGAGIGAAWGTLFGGAGELRKTSQSKNEALEVKNATIDHQLTAARQQNAQLKAGGGPAPRDNAAQGNDARKYQMHNHLAENNTPNQFTNRAEAEKAAAAKGQPAPGGVGK
ncbi:MAG: hypothetical protein P8P30_03075 [Rickettsiales bacterium]|nr:hypothetical protein [Rickettsiales bacterium]